MSNRLSKNEISRIQALRAEGLGSRTIARTLRINRETARKYSRAYDAKIKEIDADVTNIVNNPSTENVLGLLRKYILPRITK